jgi:hypothetical protein
MAKISDLKDLRAKYWIQRSYGDDIGVSGLESVSRCGHISTIEGQGVTGKILPLKELACAIQIFKELGLRSAAWGLLLDHNRLFPGCGARSDVTMGLWISLLETTGVGRILPWDTELGVSQFFIIVNIPGCLPKSNKPARPRAPGLSASKSTRSLGADTVISSVPSGRVFPNKVGCTLDFGAQVKVLNSFSDVTK